MRTHVTPEIMTKVWKLHEKEIDINLIAETLGISKSSASRIINIMETAQSGGDVDAISGNNHQGQKNFAKKYFGIEEKKEETPTESHEEKSTVEDGYFKEFAVRVLFALEHQNKLLEKICKELGIEE